MPLSWEVTEDDCSFRVQGLVEESAGLGIRMSRFKKKQQGRNGWWAKQKDQDQDAGDDEDALMSEAEDWTGDRSEEAKCGDDKFDNLEQRVGGSEPV